MVRRSRVTGRRKYLCANPMEVKLECKKCNKKYIVKNGALGSKICPECGKKMKVILE